MAIRVIPAKWHLQGSNQQPEIPNDKEKGSDDAY
jgi:hypothetical protein